MSLYGVTSVIVANKVRIMTCHPNAAEKVRICPATIADRGG